MRTPAIQLEGEVQRPASTHWLHLTTLQKGVGLTLLLGLIWVRAYRRRRRSERICSVCNQRNPRHVTNCLKCGAPLFTS